jgi:hypothetical protein
MNTINMPGFAAEASLYDGRYHDTRRYRQEAFEEQPGDLQSMVIIPQIGGEGYEGPGNCFSDCMDKHPDWGGKRCGYYCREHVGTQGCGGYGPYCSPTPPDRCDWEFGGCCTATGPIGCATVCSDGLDGCLAWSRDECLDARRKRGEPC